MTLLKGQTLETIRVKRAVVSGGGWGVAGRGGIGRAQRMFSAVQLLSLVLQWWARVTVHSSKPTEIRTPRMNPNVNYGLLGDHVSMQVHKL